MSSIASNSRDKPWVVIRKGINCQYRNDFKDEPEARNFAFAMHRVGYQVTVIEPDGYWLSLS